MKEKVTGLAATGDPKYYEDVFEKLTKLDNKGMIKRCNKLLNYNRQGMFLQTYFKTNLISLLDQILQQCKNTIEIIL